MVFIPEIEKQQSEEQNTFQLRKLKEVIAYIKANSAFYAGHLNAFEAQIENIRSLSDLQSLPVTTKEDLQQHNWDFLCIPKKDIREIMSTSGTLGSPVFIALSSNDLERLAYNEMLSFHCMEVDENDVFQLMLTLDRQFMAGIAYYSGLSEIGAAVIRSGPGLPALQWETMKALDVTGLVAVPSFITKMLDFAEEQHIPFRDFKAKKILAIGESLRDDNLEPNALAQRIKSKWNIELYSTYASTEMQTAFTECNAGKGGHHHPELIIVEILDENGNQVQKGEAGEITITTLGVEAMPLLRYRTGDIAKAYYEPCSCGRNTMRLGPVLGRKQQMIKFKGTTIYPPQLFDVLNNLEAIKDYAVTLSADETGQDKLILYVYTEMQDSDCNQLIKPVFQHKWRVVPHIIYCSAAEIQALHFADNSRKPQRFRDLRN
ncbi:phenylacetate--CoA ligase [Taibaiella lutea]|uniref:Phenylacetate--CoA ligase n=1 Tax=Taibaiella lutea TaxID=2608001 RepID=A0A5M6CX41_9BACT|nr:AMP-binding protein [Taibaiella lutea]KAA5537485.1 phenylacetate--CoA ligase [Taibaiella lutea]